MTSFSAATESLRVEESLQEAKNPASAGAELSAGATEVEREPGTDVQMGTVGSRTGVMLPSDGENGVTHTEMEEVANNDQSQLVSPVWSAYDQHSGLTGENGQGQVLILEGDRTLLLDEDGHCVYE